MEEVNKSEFEIKHSCVIPYRISNGSIELLLITSIKKQKWIFPKGFIEFNLFAFEFAKKEAYEEAGVIGENETVELGSFDLKKKNQNFSRKDFFYGSNKRVERLSRKKSAEAKMV